MQVSIQNVTFPQPGRKFGKLQLSDGQTLWVPPELLGQFRGGMIAEVGTKQQTWGQGADARQVTIVTTGPLQPSMGAQQGNSYQPSLHGTPNRETGQRANTGFQPRVYQGGGQAYGSAKSEGEQKMIFVTGVVGRAMGSGKFTASEITVLAQEAARTYDLVTRPSPKPEPVAEPGHNSTTGQGANQWPESEEPA